MTSHKETLSEQLPAIEQHHERRFFRFAPIVASVVASINYFMNSAPITGAFLLVVGGGWEYYTRRKK